LDHDRPVESVGAACAEQSPPLDPAEHVLGIK
jgi:hypothetical protein